MSELRWGRGVGALMSTAVSLLTLPTLGQCRNLTSHLSMDLVARKQAKSEFMDVIDPVSKTNFGTEPITQFGGSDVWDLDYTLLQSFEKQGDWTVGEVYTQAAWIYWRHNGPDFRVLFDGSGEQAITLKGSELGLSVGSDGLEPRFFGTGFHINLDKWSFVCVVGESDGMKGTSTFYVATPEDGIVQKAGSVPMAISGAQLQSIGAEGRCPGKLAMYKCWNGVALEHDEVQQVYEETLHLVPHPRTTIPTTSTFTSVTTTSMTSTTTSTATSTATRTSRTATSTSTYTATTTRTSHTTTTTGTHTATATARMPAELRFQLDGQPTLAESGMFPSDAEAPLDAPMFAATTTSVTTVTSSAASLSAEGEAESLANELDFIGIETRPPTTTSTTATTTPAVGPAIPSAGTATDSHSAVGGPGVGTPSSPSESSSASAGSAEAENRVSSGSSTSSATSQEASSLNQNHTSSVYSIWGEDTAESRAGAAGSSSSVSAAGTQAAGAASAAAAPGQNSSLTSATETTPAGTAAVSAATSSSLAGQGASNSGLLAGQVTVASDNMDTPSGAVASANETVGGVATAAEGASTVLQPQTVTQSQSMGQEQSQAGRYADEVSQVEGVSSGSQKAGRYADEVSQAGGVSSESQKALVQNASGMSSGALDVAAASSSSTVASSRPADPVSAAPPPSAAIPAATASAGSLTHSQVNGPSVGLPPPVSVAAPQLPQDVGVSFQAPELPTVPSVGLSPSVSLHNGMQPDGSFHFPWWALLITLGLLLCAGAAAIWACCINQASEAKKSRGARLLEASSGSYAALPTDESTAALEAGNRAKMAAVSGAAASGVAHQQHSKTHMAATSSGSSSAVAAGARGASRAGAGGATTGAGVTVRGAGQLVGRGPTGARVPLVPLSLPPPQPAQPVQPVLPPSTAALQRGVQTMQQQQLQQQLQQQPQQQQLVQLVQLEGGRQQLPMSQAQLPVSQAQLQLVGTGAQVRAPSPSQVLTASPSQVITQSQSAANTTTELLVELLSSEPLRMVSPPSSPSKTAGQSGRPLPPHRVHRQSAPVAAAQAPAGRSAPTTTAVLLPARLSASRERG